MAEKPPRLSQDEARALVEKHGSQRAAARAYGVPRATFQHWLDPELQQERLRRRYWADPDAERARHRKHWENTTGLAYSRRLMQMRRVHGLRRMDERNQQREAI